MHFLQWCRKFLHAQKKQYLPAISFPHPCSVNGTSLFYLIYCPVSVGPASVLSISYIFSWLFFLTISFTTQKTLNSQSSMLLEWNGWKLHRDELGAKGNPTKCLTKATALLTKNSCLHSPREKSILFFQTLAGEIYLHEPVHQPLISSSNNCNTKHEAALQSTDGGNPTCMRLSKPQAEILTPELKAQWQHILLVTTCSFGKYLLKSVSTIWQLLYIIKKKKTDENPILKDIHLLSSRASKLVSAECCHCQEATGLWKPLFPALASPRLLSLTCELNTLLPLPLSQKKHTLYVTFFALTSTSSGSKDYRKLAV